MQRHEAIFGIQDFFKRLVNAGEQLVQIRSLVQRMYNIGNNLTLRLHADHVSYVSGTHQQTGKSTIFRHAPQNRLEPSPRSVLTAKLPTLDVRISRQAHQTFQPAAHFAHRVGMNHLVDRLSGQLIALAVQSAIGIFVGEQYGAFGSQKCEDFTGGMQQRK